MRRFASVISIVLSVISIPACAQEALAVSDQEAIQGTWDIDAVYVNGAAANWPIQYTFIGDKVTVSHVKLGMIDGRFKLDSNTSPPQIDLFFNQSDGKLLHWKGVYALEEGRRMIVCLQTDGRERPTSIVRKAQQGLNVMILKQ